MSKYKKIFEQNFERIESLMNLYTFIKDEELKENTKEYRFTDMLRCAVVFMHSAFEDYYRQVLIERMTKDYNCAAMHYITLPNSREKKFQVKDLIEYKDKKVSEILDDAVKGKMQRTSFNNYEDIASWGKKVGLDFEDYSEQSDLNKAIERRHKIVHESDRREERLTSIDPGMVKPWANAYLELIEIIDKQVEETE